MKNYCNPLNIQYKYQFSKKQDGEITVYRETADPSIISFKGKYYLFSSMTCGFHYSDDLAEWRFHPLKSVPAYDYAPDVCVVGDYVYFSASNLENPKFYRTKDLFADDFEAIQSPFPFWDPAMFYDDDNRLYFFWGSGAGSPIYGIEMDADSLQPIGKKRELILWDAELKGFERKGNDYEPVEEDPALIEMIKGRLSIPNPNMPDEMKLNMEGVIAGKSHNEGAWMTKHKGKYYLQYATPGTEYNTYCDAVYVSDKPLGDYDLATANPFSYKPGGFLTGAGHGSTVKDKNGVYWHSSTIQISQNHNFERRIALWRAGFDKDGMMFCDQRYGDFPYRPDQKPWDNPELMLLSYGKKATASSFVEDKPPENAVNESAKSWWQATTNKSGEWLEVDLGEALDVRAIQVNFADDALSLPLPEGASFSGPFYMQRWIDETHQVTRWLLEGSKDGKAYFTIEDKSDADTDLSHDFVQVEQAIPVRYIRLTVISLPYGQAACISGLRIFGVGKGNPPNQASNVKASRQGDFDIEVSWEGNATGYTVLWGIAPDKLYHCYQVYGNEVKIGSLIKGQSVYLRVDSFNESGVTEGEVLTV